MSPNPKPITDYLADFDAPQRPSQHAAPSAAPRAPTHVPAPANASSNVPSNVPGGASTNGGAPADMAGPGAVEAAAAHAFAAGKEEGLKLAEARAALERRRRDMEEDRRTRERVAEAEERIGAMLAERLEGEIAALGARMEGDLVACLVPLAHGLAERRALNALAAEAAGIDTVARWVVTGPDRLVAAFRERVPAALRERIDHRAGEGVDLSVEIDAARLSTRLGRLRDGLEAL